MLQRILKELLLDIYLIFWVSVHVFDGMFKKKGTIKVILFLSIIEILSIVTCEKKRSSKKIFFEILFMKIVMNSITLII